MTARCIKCGKVWQVSIKADIKNYICPHCTKKSPAAATEKGSKKKLE